MLIWPQVVLYYASLLVILLQAYVILFFCCIGAEDACFINWFHTRKRFLVRVLMSKSLFWVIVSANHKGSWGMDGRMTSRTHPRLCPELQFETRGLGNFSGVCMYPNVPNEDAVIGPYLGHFGRVP